MRHLDLHRPWVWVLQLGWPMGQIVRLSSRPVDIACTATGRTYAFAGGLPAVRWRWEAPLFDVAVGQGSLTVDVDLGPDAVSWAQQRPLEGASAELAQHFVGEALEVRRKLLRARVARAVWGVGRQLVSLELEEDMGEDAGLLLDETWVVNTTDWANARDDALDQPYPIPYGKPGAFRDTEGAAIIAGTPALVVRRTTPVAVDPVTAVVAGCHVEAIQVTILDATTGGSAARTVSNSSMESGGERRHYASVNITEGPIGDFDLGASFATVDDDFYVAWNYSGAALTLDRQRALSGAGELLEQILMASTLRIDRGRLAAARSYLDAYSIDTYLNEEITSWDWVRRVLVPLLPMSLVSGPDGIFPVVWRLDAQVHEAVAHLEVGRNCTRASRDEPGDQTLYVEARVGFAPDDADSGALQRIVVMGADDGDGGDRGTCLWSVHLAQGREEAPTYTADLDQSHDADTAWLHGLDVLGRGRGGRLVEFDVGLELGGLEQGDVVTITDAERSWSGRVGLVQAVEIASAYVRVALWLRYQ